MNRFELRAIIAGQILSGMWSNEGIVYRRTTQQGWSHHPFSKQDLAKMALEQAEFLISESESISASGTVEVEWPLT